MHQIPRTNLIPERPMTVKRTPAINQKKVARPLAAADPAVGKARIVRPNRMTRTTTPKTVARPVPWATAPAEMAPTPHNRAAPTEPKTMKEMKTVELTVAVADVGVGKRATATVVAISPGVKNHAPVVMTPAAMRSPP